MGSGLEIGASRIAGSQARASVYLGVLLLAGAFAGCAADRDNAFTRARRQRELEAWQGERTRVERQLWHLQQGVAEDTAAIARLRDEAATRASERRTRLRELERELAVLQAAEQDLLASKARQAAVTAELAPLRAAEQQLVDQQAKIAALQQQAAALAPAVAAAEAEFAKVAADLQPKLADLQQKVARAKDLNAAVDAALAAVASLGAGLAPPPPPPPPAADKK